MILLRVLVLLLLLASPASAQYLSGAPTPAGGGIPIGGSCATANAIAKFTAATTLGCSLFTDDGTTATYTGTGGVSVVKVVFATGNTIGIPSDSTLTFNAANTSGATSFAHTRATITQTTGTSTTASFIGTFNPSASSTMIARSLFINPTINYAGGGNGSYCALCIDVVETAAPSGTNYAVRFRGGSAGTTDLASMDSVGRVIGTTVRSLGATGGNASLEAFDNQGDTNSRNFAFRTSQTAFGDLALLSSTTNTGQPNTQRFRWNKDGTAWIVSTLFTNLPATVVGTFTYCSDCDAPAAGIMATCTSAGTKTGAWAFRVNTTPVWGCIGI